MSKKPTKKAAPKKKLNLHKHEGTQVLGTHIKTADYNAIAKAAKENDMSVAAFVRWTMRKAAGLTPRASMI